MKIGFRSLSISDAGLFYHWLNDYEVIRYSQTRFLKKQSKEEVEEWLVELLSNTKDYTVEAVEGETDTLIGYAGICSISQQNKAGEYFILIGDKDYWSKGFGTEVTKQVVGYGFEKLNLHRIQLTVSELNVGGVKAYEQAGFKREGVLRDACFRDGMFHDKIMMSVLKDEWQR